MYNLPPHVNTPRELLAMLVRGGGDVVLPQELAAEAARVIDELGSAQAEIINHKAEIEKMKMKKDAYAQDAMNARAELKREKQSLHDMAVISAMGAGKSPEHAMQLADNFLELRLKRLSK